MYHYNKKNIKMINYNYIARRIIEEHNPNWSQIPDHLHRMLIIGASGSVKTNDLINQIKQQDDHNYGVVGKIYLYVKDPNEANINILSKM